MKILITGATGLVGSDLGQKLVSQGHEIYVISRNASRAKAALTFQCQVIEADLEKSAIKGKIPPMDVVFHLAGESVAGHRWSTSRKKSIYDSRINGTKNLFNSLSESPQIIIGASAIGFYGDRGLETLTEASSSGHDFLAQVCQDWEKELFEARKIFSSEVHITALRLGLVLSKNGGALKKMIFPFRAGLGGPLGSGQQIVSWIHIDDLTNQLIWVMNQKLSGVYNAVAPNSVTNLEFSKTLAKILNRPCLLMIPKAVLKIIFGEMSQILLSSQKVSCAKIQKTGFKYQYSELVDALKECL